MKFTCLALAFLVSAAAAFSPANKPSFGVHASARSERMPMDKDTLLFARKSSTDQNDHVESFKKNLLAYAVGGIVTFSSMLAPEIALAASSKEAPVTPAPVPVEKQIIAKYSETKKKTSTSEPVSKEKQVLAQAKADLLNVDVKFIEAQKAVSAAKANEQTAMLAANKAETNLKKINSELAVAKDKVMEMTRKGDKKVDSQKAKIGTWINSSSIS